MREIIVSEFMTLDGVFETPEEWSLEYFADDISRFKHDELFESDALLLGRVTFEVFAGSWPERTDDTGFADRINSMPKHVVSTTLDDPGWNASVIRGGLPDSVRQLKDEGDGILLVNGSGQLVGSLAQYDLVDEYRLITYPVVLGEGRGLFQKGATAKLQFVEAKPFETGPVLLRYRSG
jgi:dihydrofolate reductase